MSNTPLMAGVSELLILRLLAEREMYGYELARTIRVLTGEAIAVGESVLYPVLHSLERRRLLKARRKLVNGRTRVYYAITPGGAGHLGKLSEDWQRIAAGVDMALRGAGHA